MDESISCGRGAAAIFSSPVDMSLKEPRGDTLFHAFLTKAKANAFRTSVPRLNNSRIRMPTDLGPGPWLAQQLPPDIL